MNSHELDLVQKWVEINRKLEEGWAPLRDLAGEREIIEKQVPFLKNKGVSPYPPKAVQEKPSSSSILLESPSKPTGPPSKKPRKENSETGARRAVEKVKGQGKAGGSSKSEIGLDKDDSQSFQGNQ